MNVSDLIAMLNKLPPDMELWRHSVGDDLPVDDPEQIDMRVSSDEKRLYIEIYDGYVDDATMLSLYIEGKTE